MIVVKIYNHRVFQPYNIYSRVTCMTQKIIFNTLKKRDILGFVWFKCMTIVILDSWEWEQINLSNLPNIQNLFILKLIIY
jgi:hypothetical protein